MTIAKKDIPSLTGIRFLAASLVFLFHYAEIIFSAANRQFGYYFFRQFNVGVSMFFVLSGFLITYRYYALLSSGASLGNYFIRRIARIFPLYWAVLFLHFLLLWKQKHQLPDVETIFLNLTMLHGFSARYFFSGLTQSWSLTVEETFYFYAPICFSLIRYRSFFLRQIPVLLTFGFLLVGVSNVFLSTNFFPSIAFLLSGTFFGRCVEFFAGIFLARLIRKQEHSRKGVMFTLGGSALFFLFLLALAVAAFHDKRAYYNDSLLSVLLGNLLLPISVAIFYYGLAMEDTLVKRLLSSKMATLFGKSSYAFYLFHIGVIAEVFYFHVTTNLLALFLFLQFLSILTYKFFERPVYFFLLNKLLIGEQQKNIKDEYEAVCSAKDEAV